MEDKPWLRLEDFSLKRNKFRTVFISDAHLGSRGCKAEVLAAFLKSIDTRTLYLVGDIVDVWRLESRSYWPAAHNEVVRHILKLVKRGTRVVFVPATTTKRFVRMGNGLWWNRDSNARRAPLFGRSPLVDHPR